MKCPNNDLHLFALVLMVASVALVQGTRMPEAVEDVHREGATWNGATFSRSNLNHWGEHIKSAKVTRLDVVKRPYNNLHLGVKLTTSASAESFPKKAGTLKATIVATELPNPSVLHDAIRPFEEGQEGKEVQNVWGKPLVSITAAQLNKQGERTVDRFGECVSSGPLDRSPETFTDCHSYVFNVVRYAVYACNCAQSDATKDNFCGRVGLNHDDFKMALVALSIDGALELTEKGRKDLEITPELETEVRKKRAKSEAIRGLESFTWSATAWH